MSNIYDHATKAAWYTYKTVSDYFIRRYEWYMKKNPSQETAKTMNRILFTDLVINTYKRSPETAWMLLRDPRVQKYIKLSGSDMADEMIGILRGELAPKEYIAAIMPENYLTEYDLTHRTKYSEIENFGKYSKMHKDKEMMDAEMDAYNAFSESYDSYKPPINTSEGAEKKSKTSDDKEVPKNSNQIEAPEEEPKRKTPASTTTTTTTTTTKPSEPVLPAPMEVDQARQAGGSNSIGHHGSFYGNTARNAGFEKSRYERDIVKSHLRKDLITYWGMSKFVTDYNTQPQLVDDMLFGGKKTGVLSIRKPALTGNQNASLEFPYQTKNTHLSLCNQVYGQYINLLVNDFLDYKTLNATGGKLRQYRKLSLDEIHVEFEIHTRKGSAFENECYVNEWDRGTDGDLPSRAELRGTFKDLTWSPQYLIYRDAAGFFSTSNSNIPNNPEYVTPATEEDPPRKLQSLKLRDQNIDIVSKGFSFTRKVQAGGPYYITPSQLWNIRISNIASLINEIEGQSADSTGVLTKWPEYFNFLIAPLNADMVMCTSDNNNKAFITPNFHTEIHMKCTSTWFCMDSTLGPNQDAARMQTVNEIKLDPYYKANSDLNQEILYKIGTH